jgi:hypothetical protein
MIRFRVKVAFAALIAAQTAHSAEEYVGRLWESLAPARFLSGLISSDREFGFVVLNSVLVIFGLWCFLFPVRKEWPAGAAFIWVWTVVEAMNGTAHIAWTLIEGGYTPGLLTAPFLLGISLYLVFQMRNSDHFEGDLRHNYRASSG